MKPFSIVILLFLFSCQRNDQKNILLDYVTPENDKTREYVADISDTTMMRIYISQQRTKLEDGSVKISYLLKSVDSLLINSTEEVFYADNSFELISSSLYETDPLNNSVEISAKILKGGKQTFNDSPMKFEMLYKFKVDSGITLHSGIAINYRFQFIDSLKSECLVSNASIINKYTFSDNRNDTTIYSQGQRLYLKGKGLISFEEESGSEKTIFVLKN